MEASEVQRKLKAVRESVSGVVVGMDDVMDQAKMVYEHGRVKEYIVDIVRRARLELSTMSTGFIILLTSSSRDLVDRRTGIFDSFGFA